nr:hypothetical protein CUMW_160400 [Ipomoea batatas]
MSIGHGWLSSVKIYETLPGIIQSVSSCHERRLDGSRAPSWIELSKHGGQSTDVRTCHGGAGHNHELRSSIIHDVIGGETRFVVGAELPEYKEVPVKLLPFPNVTTAGNSLSIVEAPTVKIHGALLSEVDRLGPVFAAEQETRTPFCTAPKAPIAMGSSLYGQACPQWKSKARIGDRPLSEKLRLSGQIPLSRTPIIISAPKSELGPRTEEAVVKPKNWGDLVVWSWRRLSGRTEMTPVTFASSEAWEGVRRAEKPWATCS